MSIQQLFMDAAVDKLYYVSGWVRTCRTSSTSLGFCNINDGSNVNGLQIVLSDEHMHTEVLNSFFKDMTSSPP